MKAIQITLDERLLARLDADEEVKRAGRSAVIRHAVLDYLRRKRRSSVAEAYRRTYGDGRTPSWRGGRMRAHGRRNRPWRDLDPSVCAARQGRALAVATGCD